jgi:hypothetical protein
LPVVAPAEPVAPTVAPATTGAPVAEVSVTEPFETPPVNARPIEIPKAAIDVAALEIIALLAKEDPAFDVAVAQAKLAEPLTSADVAIRSAAEAAQKAIAARIDSQVRSAARAAADDALEFLAQEEYPAAVSRLEVAIAALPEDSAWVKNIGRAQLTAVLDKINATRAAELTVAFAGLEDALRQQTPESAMRLAALRKHADPKFREKAESTAAAINAELAAKLAEQRRVATIARNGWVAFFNQFNTAVLAGDLDAAAKLCKPAPDSVTTPQAVLDACAAEVAGLRALQDLVLKTSNAAQNKQVNLVLRKGKAVGALAGTEDRKLRIALTGGAIVGVKLETLTAAAYNDILDPRDIKQAKLELALWGLTAHENLSAAETFLTRVCEKAKTPVPLHWQEYFRLQGFSQNAAALVMKLNALQKAVAERNPEMIREAMIAARPELNEFLKFSALNPEQQKIVDDAEAIAGRLSRMQLILQNGSFPTPEYTGQVSDQISEYKDSATKTDVGVQFGLKLGASGGVQRALLRFEGLESAIGKAHVRKATLEMYQIDSPSYKGAMIGFFRLKRSWVPDSGTWTSYDSLKRLDWAVPGAGAVSDVEAKADALLTLDDKKNIWRSIDVTAYVQDVLNGKIQNNGFLLRVINGEPQFHVRFYPESDTATLKDKTLRPRLILDLEQEAPPAN